MKKPKPIRSILEQTLKGLDLEGPLKGYSIFRAWEEIVGESIAAQTRPRAIRNEILFIDVSHPTWVQQLQFLKPVLLQKINDFLGEPRFNDIRFRLGKIPQRDSSSSKAGAWRDEALQEGRVKRLEELLQSIDDEEVRKGLREVLLKGAKLEQFREKSK